MVRSARLAVVQEFSTPCSVLCTHFAIHPFCLEKGKFRQQKLLNDSPFPFHPLPLSNRPMQKINFVTLIPMVLFLHLGPGPWERSCNYFPYAGTHEMELASPIQAHGVNPFPSRFTNRTIPLEVSRADRGKSQ